MMCEGDFLDVIKDCVECVKELSFLTVWQLKDGRFVICTLTDSGYFKIFEIHDSLEFAINNAIYWDKIL